MQGHGVRQGFVGDEHPGWVGADVVNDSLQAHRVVDQDPDLLLFLVGVTEILVGLHGGFQGAGLERYHPGYPVHVPVAHAHASADVPEGGLGGHGAEGDDLGYVVAAVPADHVVQHLVPPVVLEVHVDVRHLLPLQVQEALEDQAVLQRIDIGDAQAVEGDAGRRAAPDAVEDPAPSGEVDDVPHDQEVVGELGVADDFQLVLHPLLGLWRRRAVARGEPFPTELREVLVGVDAAGGLVPGQVGLPESQLHVAHIGYPLGVFQGLRGLRVVWEECGHFFGALDVV